MPLAIVQAVFSYIKKSGDCTLEDIAEFIKEKVRTCGYLLTAPFKERGLP